MKKQNEIEIDGIGKVYIYSVKVDKPEFKQVTPDMQEVKSKRVGETSKTVYIDASGKEWTKDSIGYNINGRFIQKVEKTERVKAYKIVDKVEYIGNFMADNSYVVVPADEQTVANLISKGAYESKALEFTYKKSSVGMSFHRAVVYMSAGVLRMDTSERPAFWNTIAEQVKLEMMERDALKAALSFDNKSEVCVKAEEIEVVI